MLAGIPKNILPQGAQRFVDETNRWFGVPEWALATFLVVGSIKAHPWLAFVPVDLTLITWAALVAGACWSAFRTDFRIPTAMFWPLALAVLILPTLLWMEWHPYGYEKVSRFYTLTLVAIVAPAFIVQTSDSLRRFLACLVAIGLFVTGDALYAFLFDPTQFARDSAVFNPEDARISTIAVGIAGGTVLLWVNVHVLMARINLAVAAIIGGIATIVMYGSGSRGPLVAIVAAIGAVAGGLFMGNGKSFGRIGLIVIAAVIGLSLSLPFLPSGSVSRIEAFFEGETSDSETVRAEYIETALVAIPDAPLGLGLGGFADHSRPYTLGDRVFIHNLFLEMVLEGGWAAGTAFLVWTAAALLRVYQLAREAPQEPVYAVLFGLLVFMGIMSAISGELNDSKLFLAILTVAIAVARQPAAPRVQV